VEVKKIILGIIIIVVLMAGYIVYSFGNFTAVSKGQPVARYESPSKALLVIDIQRGITDKESTYGLDPAQRDEMLKNNNRIFESKKAVGLQVIYIRQVFADDFMVKLFTAGKMQKGSTGAQISRELKVVSKNIFTKHISDAFSNPKLDAFLIANKVSHLYITGLDAEACVDKTVKAALNRKYKVTVIKDAIAGKSDERRDKKIADFSELGAKIITTADFLK